MRLEKIILHGFKSFAEKTEIQVLPGITAIVGPNGGGKSNIAEAIRWALGEQSPKSLRGHKMEDVIFHGSASRKPIGMAEASLILANDGALPVPWSEIQVSRRLYRTGESEYLLNKNLCRLRDILDLFVGTGVNPKAYALMEQERLNQILTAKPLDRRVFIEEAAGISRYKQQRAETLGKLEATRQNLLRIRDVMNEVKRQLSALERQARKARQYKAFQQERRSLAVTLLASDYASLTAQDRERERELARLREGEERIRAHLSALGARQATQRAQIQEREHRLADLRQAVQKIQGEVERLLERREQIGLQMRDLGEEDLRLQEEMRLIGERRQALAEERGEKDLALQIASESQRQNDESIRLLEEALGQLRVSLQADRTRLESLRLDQVRAGGERAELTRRAGELREREAQLHRRQTRLTQERAEARAEAERIENAQSQLEAQRAQALLTLSALEERRGRLEMEMARLEAARLEVQTDLAESRLSLAARQSSLEALERLEREREGYGAGVRAILAPEGRQHLRGVIGTVADLLDVPAELELAVEAVLGDRLSWVVMERFEDGKAALTYLDHCGAGTATFLPLETLPTANGLPPEEEGVRWAARLVGCRHEALLYYLLGRVAVVPHLSQAEMLWRKNGVVATYVTPSGEALSPTGRLTGGRSGEPGTAENHSLLRRKSAIRQLSEEVARLGGEVKAAQTGLATLEVELAQLKSEQSTLQRSIQGQETAQLSGEKDLEQATRERERLDRYREALEAEDRQLATEAEEASVQAEELERALDRARRAEASLEALMTELRCSVEMTQERESRLVADLTSTQVEWASLGERVEALRREMVHLEGVDRDLVERLAQAAGRRQVVSERQQDLSLEQERTDLRAREVAVDRDRLEGEERDLSRNHHDLLAVLEEIETAMKESERELEGVMKESHAVELQATEGRVRRQELEQEARRSFGVESHGLTALHDPDRDLEPVRSRLAELDGKIEAMGPVNLVADEEYRELEERLEFLRTQHDDLTASMRDLEKALRGMTRTAQERFLQAFEAINGHFGQIFSRLFEGGRAELRIVEAEEGGDPLDSGLELMAQPRGKRLGSVSLLSGGEKALTGLALLFAIFYYRPSPFCVLDEVDAPLDDANIHRFLRVLRELCRDTQFIVITHNRKTMEVADVLYGITMEEPGLSRLVSVKLTD
jgi:chromosome segregation protein